MCFSSWLGAPDMVYPSWLGGAYHALSVMAGRVPATRPRSADARRALYNRWCVGGRDTPGHDG